jgi:hypothetical protein
MRNRGHPGESLPVPAEIAVHVPSGSKYAAATGFNSFYRITTMSSVSLAEFLFLMLDIRFYKSVCIPAYYPINQRHQNV